jgi:hypothetical protein
MAARAFRGALPPVAAGALAALPARHGGSSIAFAPRFRAAAP